MAPMSTPAGGLAHEQHQGIALDLPGEHQLLLIAAGECGGVLTRVGGPHVESVHLFHRIAGDRGPVEQRPALIASIVVIAEDGGFAGLEGQDEAHAPAILGHVGKPMEAPDKAAGTYRLAREANPPSGHRPESGQCLQQLALSVAGHPGDADDLARPHRE